MKSKVKNLFNNEAGSNDALNHILQRFSDLTGLKKNQFGFFQQGDDGYATLIAIKDDELFGLGELCYEPFIRNARVAHHYQAVTDKFLELCAKKFDDENCTVPTLVGNTEMWDEVYKEAMRIGVVELPKKKAPVKKPKPKKSLTVKPPIDFDGK